MAYIGTPVQQALTKVTSQSFNGTGSQTVFTLNRAVNTGEELEVFVNNVQQEPGVGKSYTATGTTLTFDAAPSSGTGNVYVIYRGLAEVTRRLEHDPNAALAATTGTFSGDLTVDTNTLYVDSTNNRVGVGTSSPSHPLTVDGQIKSIGTNGETVQLQTSSQYTGISFIGSDGTRDAIIDYDHTNGVMGLKAHTAGHYINFLTGGYTERFRITDNGVTFNGDTAAANALDDYEEGTWSSVPIVGTYSFNNPRYTKIGRMVHCHVQIGTISDNSSSQSLRIQLPFAAVASDSAVTFGTLYVNVSRNPIVGGYLSGTTDLILYVNNTFSQLFHSDTNSGTSIYAAWSYMAAS